MASNFVQELFQAFAPLLNESFLKNAVVLSEWKLTFERFAGQLRNNDLNISQLERFDIKITMIPWSLVPTLHEAIRIPSNDDEPTTLCA
jgi:hypothetical protein